VTNLQGSMIVLHGPPKVGKTQFVSSMPGPVQFIATEHGHKYIPETQQKRVIYLPSGKDGWERFRKMLSEKILLRRKCRTVAIDTTTKLYERCLDWTCAKNKWAHPSEGAHGRGWHAVRTEFGRQVEILADQCADLDATLVFVDHTDVTEINLATKVFHKMQVSMPTQPRSVVLPVADHIFFLGYAHMQDVTLDSTAVEGNMRWLWIGGSEAIEAGTRAPGIATKIIKKLPKTGQYKFVVSQLNQGEAE
jgi:hypothetical protein